MFYVTDYVAVEFWQASHGGHCNQLTVDIERLQITSFHSHCRGRAHGEHSDATSSVVQAVLKGLAEGAHVFKADITARGASSSTDGAYLTLQENHAGSGVSDLLWKSCGRQNCEQWDEFHKFGAAGNYALSKVPDVKEWFELQREVQRLCGFGDTRRLARGVAAHIGSQHRSVKGTGATRSVANADRVARQFLQQYCYGLGHNACALPQHYGVRRQPFSHHTIAKSFQKCCLMRNGARDGARQRGEPPCMNPRLSN